MQQTLPFATSTDQEVQGLLEEYQIALTVDEARKISELLGRDPTITEAVVWGIQGSEHCSYKSSRRFLNSFVTEGKHIILGPVEDSGIVAITDQPNDKRWGLVISHESHNHPSQIVPYEGAATGIGGVVRDVVCMGARIVGCLDPLRLGDLQTEESRTIASEVIRGIAGYGNPLGIPNLGGETVFDSTYNNNCLVNAIALGIVREDEIFHSYAPKEAGTVGYDIIIVGKPTDKSGFGGASFASLAMDEEKTEQNTGAVQEPNPFLERHLLASMYSLFDWLAANGKLNKVSCKDLGAGGVVCASVEQVSDQGFGAEVAIDKVHVSMEGLRPEVIACAETQERFSFTCHPDLTDHIIKHFNEVWDLPSVAEGAQASVVGKVNDSGIYKLTFNGEVIMEAKATDVTCGLQYTRPTAPNKVDGEEPEIICEHGQISISHPAIQPSSHSIKQVFESMLSHPNHASKERAYKHYDKNVIGNTILEPGEADAGVIAPLQDLSSYVHEGTHPGWQLSEEEKWRGVAVSADGNCRYGRIDPYWQGVNATLEAMRNVVAVGATPRALTDCLCYGNPEIPEQLWELEEGVRGIADAGSKAQFDGEPVPVISGNVSLYNGKPDGSSIDPSAIVSCVGIMPDARKAVSMQLKKAGSSLILIGERKDECGGSAYYQILEELGNANQDAMLGCNVPMPNMEQSAKEMQFVLNMIGSSNVHACHDISEGGLLLALFEMTLPQRKRGGDIGININLDVLKSDLSTDKLLFSETGGFILEVDKDKEQEIREAATAASIAAYPLGLTVPEPEMTVRRENKEILREDCVDLANTWKYGLKSRI